MWRYVFPAMLIVFFANCQQKTNTKSNPNNNIIIAAAANVQFAAQEMEMMFEQMTGNEVELVVSSSGKLTAQILQGAPYDIFISADMKYPDSLYANGFATTPPRVYALGTLVLWSCRDIEISQDLQFLQKDEVQKIAIANPTTAPYGIQAVRLLQYYNLYESVASKLVYGESIAQTNQYIAAGAAEVGFTAKSIVLAPAMQNKGRWVEMDDRAYDAIRQGIVITKYGDREHPETSAAFLAFLLGNEGRTILEKYGYQLPPKQ